MSTVDCTAVNHEAIVVHQEPQSVVISRVTPKLVRVYSITVETVLPTITQQLMQTYNDSASTEDTEIDTSLFLKTDEK